MKPCEFSPCRKYRYTLWRQLTAELKLNDEKWPGDYVQFIGLNPSTADEWRDDPTIRRCKAFAEDWGFASMCMTNLFAFRETNPDVMKKQPDPIGLDNDRWLVQVASGAGLIVAAWGVKGGILGRDVAVKKIIHRLHCLRKTKDGFPEHPLYLPKTLSPIPL